MLATWFTAVHHGSHVTRWLDYLFSIRSFATTKFCPTNSIKIGKSGHTAIQLVFANFNKSARHVFDCHTSHFSSSFANDMGIEKERVKEIERSMIKEDLVPM